MKKIMSMIMAAAMTVSLCSIPVSAANADAEKIGLSVTGSNQQIFIKDDGLWVFPHPWHGSYAITNYTLYNNKLASSAGYTLRMTDSDKKQYSSDHVNSPVVGGSYLRAVKDSETIYIPVWDQVEGTETGINQNFFGGYCPKSEWANKDAKGVFGRGFDESAYLFTIPANAESTQSARVEYSFGSPAETTAPITTEISLYVDGNAEACISKNGGHELVKIAADGKASYNSQGTMKDTGLTLETGKWHRIAISIDKPKNDWSTLWIDGNQYTNIGQTWRDFPTQLRFGVASNSGEGQVAYADPRVYYGYYNKAYDSINVTGDSTLVTVDTTSNTVKYNDALIQTADELASAIKDSTDARTVKIYTDASKKAIGLTDDSVVVIVPKSGGIASTYSLIKGATPMQKIGLVISDIYTRGFSWAGGESSVPNLYIKKDNQNIVVLSSPNNDYTVYAYKFLDSLKSSTGYTLSVVDGTKEFERSGLVMEDGQPLKGTRDVDKVVNGDYLKGVKGNDVIYIPIVNKIELLNYEDLTKTGGNNWQTDVVTVESAGGIAGKATDDIAYKMTPKSYPLSKLSKLQLEGSEIKQYYSGKPYTYAVNVYADGDAAARIYSTGSDGVFSNALYWNADGSFTYDKDGTETRGDFTLERGRWHRVAITFEPNRNRRNVWIDGTLVTNLSRYTTSMGRIDLAVEKDSASGSVAYDDLRVYEGFYDPSEDDATFAGANVSTVAGQLSYTSDITSLAQIKAELGTDNVTLYTDNTFSTTTENVADAQIALVLSQSGDGYHYFKLNKVEKDNMLVITNDGKTVTANTLYTVPSDTTIYLAEYADGILVQVKSNITNTIAKAEQEMTATAGNTYKAFLWDNNMQSLAASAE